MYTLHQNKLCVACFQRRQKLIDVNLVTNGVKGIEATDFVDAWLYTHCSNHQSTAPERAFYQFTSMLSESTVKTRSHGNLIWFSFLIFDNIQNFFWEQSKNLIIFLIVYITTTKYFNCTLQSQLKYNPPAFRFTVDFISN